MTKIEHIALLFDGFDQGGIGKVNQVLCETLLENDIRVDLLVFSSNGPRKSLFPKHATIYDLERSAKFLLILKIAKYLRSQQPDGVIVANAITASYVAIANLLSPKKIKIIGVHHTNIDTDLNRKSNILRRLFIRVIPKIATSYLGLTLAAVSQGGRGALSKRTGVPESNIQVLSNPVALDDKSTTIPNDLYKWWHSGSYKMLTVGRLTPEKGHINLIRALSILTQESDPKLIVIGYGPYEGKLIEEVVRLSLEDQVRFVGFEAYPKPYFVHADIFALSSISESLPLTIIEALSQGTQVVSTDCEYGPSEILEDGKYGALVPINNPEKLAQAIEHCRSSPYSEEILRSRADEYSPHIIVRRYLSLIGQTKINRINR